MVISITKDELVVLGARYRANYLVEQAGYTLGIAAKDGERISDLLPESFISEVNDTLSEVRAALQNTGLMKQEAKDATRKQNSAVADAKVWRRKVVKRSIRATRFSTGIPGGLLAVGRTSKIPELQGQLETMIALFEQNLGKMPGKGADKLLQEGKDILADFRTSDAEQEVKKLRSLPDAVQAFYEKKGLLYVSLKAINEAGHELYANDSEGSSKYNLAILYRAGAKRKNNGAPPAEEQKK